MRGSGSHFGKKRAGASASEMIFVFSLVKQEIRRCRARGERVKLTNIQELPNSVSISWLIFS